MDLVATAPAFESLPARRFLLCFSDTWQHLVDQVHPASAYFALFIAADSASTSADVIRTAANELVSRGLASLCTWGSGCERVHDLFDAVDIERRLEAGEELGPGDVVMTTWHDDESLAGALWYFVTCALPTDHFLAECKDWVIAIVGNRDWEDPVRNHVVKFVTRPKEVPE